MVSVVDLVVGVGAMVGAAVAGDVWLVVVAVFVAVRSVAGIREAGLLAAPGGIPHQPRAAGTVPGTVRETAGPDQPEASPVGRLVGVQVIRLGPVVSQFDTRFRGLPGGRALLDVAARKRIQTRFHEQGEFVAVPRPMVPNIEVQGVLGELQVPFGGLLRGLRQPEYQVGRV